MRWQGHEAYMKDEKCAHNKKGRIIFSSESHRNRLRVWNNSTGS
jgi:hypothetical protein